PQEIQNAVRSIGDATFNFSRQTGASPEYSDNQLSGYLNKLFGTVIERRLAAGDVTGAQRLYDEGTDRDLITGEGAARLQERLKPYQQSQEAARAFSVATGGPIATKIAQTAQNAGVDPGVALGIWSAEGGVTNPALKNPKSSATGIFQFLDSTWANAGGVPENRMDADEQISRGIQSIRENTEQLRKDLGRSPLPREIYLAHQQGVEGAVNLLRADPNAKAADIVGEKAVTQNGGTADSTAGQFLATVADMYRRHAGMYNADGTPSAQNYQRNYAAGLQAVTDLAGKEHPEDPAAVERYRNFYIQQAGQSLEVARMIDRANRETLRQGLIGPNGAKSWSEFLSDPNRAQAYTDSVQEDPDLSGRVDSVLSANASGNWDPPASAKSGALYDELKGMQITGRDSFANLDLMRYYGSVPAAQFQELQNAQALVRNQDPAAAQNQARLTRALVFANPIFVKAGIDPDPTSANYNIAVGRLDSALRRWSANNNNKLPDDSQIVQVAQQMIFPGGEPEKSGGTGGWLLSALSPDEAQAKVPAPDDKNSGESIGAGTNMVQSRERVDEAAGTQHQAWNTSSDRDTIEPGEANDKEMMLAAAARGVSEKQAEPNAGLTIIKDVPSGAVTYRTNDGQEFLAPAQADWNAVFEAGKANGLNPFGIRRAVGHFGEFDFQRDGSKKVFYDDYVHASNFAVGVFMRGAGFSLAETKVIGRMYADLKSTNPHKEEQSEWWIRGWMAANFGKFPTKLQ
ncbi:MAG: hypothetical protein ACP5SH_16265, partial [Syntrophobacteraceae bacterium]